MPATVGELRAAPYNPRKISKEQLIALGKSMRQFGDLSGIVVNLKTGHVVGGHQRLKNLDPNWKIEKAKDNDSSGTVASGWIQTPWGRISYREVSWTEAMEKAANLAANKHGGEFNMDDVAKMLEELDGELDLDLTGFLKDERLNLMEINPDATLADAEEIAAVPKTPKTKKGDLYIFDGKHRLLCGDAANVDDVVKLMCDIKADMMWTDPPYGVSYVGKTKEKKTIQNDASEDTEGLLKSAFAWASQVLAPGAAIYVAHPAGALSVVFGKAFVFTGWRLHETLIWVKDSMVLGHSDYHYKHEPIYFGYTKCDGRVGRGGKNWYGRNDETTVFEIPRPKSSQEHPTMKPVALIEQMIRNSSPINGLVYEPFCGSGSTLIAAEMTGRRCNAIELDPGYCDVIVDRWEKFTGRQALLAAKNSNGKKENRQTVSAR